MERKSYNHKVVVNNKNNKSNETSGINTVSPHSRFASRISDSKDNLLNTHYRCTENAFN